MVRPIPEGATLIQEGLYLHEVEKTIAGRPFISWYLYSAEGYCFYNLTVAENFDEEGNLVPPEDRVYAQYSIVPYNTDLSIFVSVPVQEGYEIVSVPSVDTEIA